MATLLPNERSVPLDQLPQTLTGLPAGSRSYVLTQLIPTINSSVIVVTDTDVEAEGLLADVEAWAPLFLKEPKPELLWFPESESAARISALGEMKRVKRFILFVSKDALKTKTYSPKNLDALRYELRPGKNYPRLELLERLAKGGYARTDMVTLEGETAVRGEVVDVWAPGASKPWRLLFDGDTLESLREFHPGTQRTEGYLDPKVLWPVRENDVTTSLVDHLPADALWFWNDVEPEEGASERRIVYRGLGVADIDFGFHSTTGLGSGLPLVAKAALQKKNEGYKVFFFSFNAGESERLAELLEEQIGPSAMEEMEFLVGTLRSGFYSPQRTVDSQQSTDGVNGSLLVIPRLAVFTNSEIFGRFRHRPRLAKFKGGGVVREAGDLKGGDYVVHEHYGIGRYKGLELINAGGQEAEFLRLEYRGGDRLFVPVYDLKQVQKYSGSEGAAPRLNSLDTASWEKVKERVKEGVQELAQDLLKIHAARVMQPGYAFPKDNHLEEEFAASFLYEETQDQLRSIEEVKRDMQADKPMDRLIFGDVGYGKTEVAMRAAFKAVMDSKQVAVLVPTTILAEQHYRTFSERFADYPAKLGVISRFQSAKEQKETILGVANGTIDIIIGTHRLFQKDVVFHDLGLLIIDEEHRFGVKHKERLKKLRQNLDVLTMTATPIPRTLSLAMSGMREMSMIITPPTGRLPIKTHVGPFDDDVVKRAVETELERHGQVFFVHNRVKSLNGRKEYLQKLFPNLSIATVHGQMTGPAIEKTMWEFLHNKHQILLATSIIESGIDIPTVNTLIVEEAEEFGLAQLYQLRGRVGRERQKAYCYLFYSPSVPLSGDARARLEALREFTELGSGYHLAMRDMEIRGAGNMLGQQQHGFIASVGIDLYTQLLQEEMAKLKGEPPPQEIRFPTMDLAVRAYLPTDYIPSEEMRVTFYKKLISAPKTETMEALRAEMEDRFGPLPDPAERLYRVSLLRLTARELGVDSVVQKPSSLEIAFLENTPIQPQRMIEMVQKHKGWKIKPAGVTTLLQIPAETYENRGSAQFLDELFQQLGSYM